MEKTNAHKENSELIDKLEIEAIEKINSIKKTIPIHKKGAIELIKTNAFQVRGYLNNIEEEGYHLGENFEPDREIFGTEYRYSWPVSRIEHHVTMIRIIPEILENEGYGEAMKMNRQC